VGETAPHPVSVSDTLSRWASDLLRVPDVVFGARDRVWLAAPLLLALLLPLFLRRSRSALPALLLRTLALAALLSLLLEPQVLEREKVEGSLLVIADVSPSVGDAGRARESEYLKAAASPFDLVPFGMTPLPGRALEPDPRPATDIGRALRLADARTEEPARVVLLSDGRATRPGAEQAALRLRAGGTELYAFAVPDEEGARGPEVRAETIEAPPRSERLEPFPVTARVHASSPCPVGAALYVDGKLVQTVEADLPAGPGEIAFEGVAMPAGRHEVQVLVSGDATPHNNLAGTEIEVPGIPRVLLLAASKRPSLVAKALETQGFSVEVAAAADLPDLKGFDAVVLLPDAPVHDLEAHFGALQEFVGKRGGGLLAIGGRDGPGLARLALSPVAFLLPLEFEPREAKSKPTPEPKPQKKPKIEIKEEEQQAFPITLCLVVDRSGSMEDAFKLRQAKAAAIAAAQSLTKDDRITIIAFGNTAEVILAPTAARDDAAVAAAVEAITSEGHTMMFQALATSYALMGRERTPIRHVVLVTDGMSSDDGKWLDLLNAMTGEGITVSTVGIGLDVDAPKLARLAQWGKGRYWLAQPHEIPQVVTQDTLRVMKARGERGKDAERAPPSEPPAPEPPLPPADPPPPAPPPHPAALSIVAEPGAPLDMLKGIPPEELPKVAAPEEGKPRFASWVAARAGPSPLLAYFRLGLGSAAALTVDPEAPAEGALRAHPEFPRLLAQLLRSVLPDASAEPFVLHHAADGDTLSLRVVGEDGRPRTDLDLSVTVDGAPLALVRRADRYEAALPPRDAPAAVSVRAEEGGRSVARAFLVPPATNVELSATGPDRAALFRLVGDAERLDAAAEVALRRPEAEVARLRPFPLPFLLLAAILLPFDAWLRRRIRSVSR
jgi:Mg-chelatase subunit ChlD